MDLMIAALWLFLPAAFANMAAALGRHLKFLDFLAVPVDMGKEYRGVRILGNNKTLRGFILGTLFGVIFAYILKEVYFSTDLKDLVEIDYSNFNVFIFGGLLGFGALFGDSVESFFKRQKGIKSGEPWIGFDQIDFIIGSVLFTIFYHNLELEGYTSIFIVYFIGHFLIKYLGFIVGLENKKI